MQALLYIEKYYLYVADALQVVTAKHVGAQTLYTGGKHVHEVAVKEGIGSVYLSQNSKYDLRTIKEYK